MARNRGKVDFSTVRQTELDILIPVFSNFMALEKNIMALNDFVKDIDYRITLIDDASPDYAEEGKKLYQTYEGNPRIRVLRNMKNLGFPQTVNHGAKETKAPYMLILNSDVILIGDSVKIMLDHMKANPDIGIIFPKLMFFPNSQDNTRPAGKIQHCGIVFDINASPYHRFVGWDADHPFVNRVEDLNAATGACMLTRRALWNDIGGFDPAYGRGTYEDLDYSLSTRLRNMKIRYLPQAMGFHYVGLSVEKLSEGFPLNRNQAIFRAKFGDVIPYDEFHFSGSG